MELKAMLHKRLTEDKRLAEMLAEFCEQPAIFYGQAPTADCEEWGDEQYPRIDYLIDMQENPARNASGVLSINAWCDADSGATTVCMQPLPRRTIIPTVFLGCAPTLSRPAIKTSRPHALLA